MLGLLALVCGADPTFEVVNRCPPAFVVVNKCPAPAVAAPRPFAMTSASGPGTPARPAAEVSSSKPAPDPFAAVTITNARWTIRGGGTFRNCGPSG